VGIQEYSLQTKGIDKWDWETEKKNKEGQGKDMAHQVGRSVRIFRNEGTIPTGMEKDTRGNTDAESQVIRRGERCITKPTARQKRKRRENKSGN